MTYTLQQAFDKVWEHFVVNGNGPSRRSDGSCVYRGPKGAKCAIGLLIPDEEYRPSFEDKTAFAVVDACPSLAGLGISVLDDLQDCHDSACESHDFASGVRTLLTEYSTKYGLQIPATA